MATYTSGILGAFSGKVGNVVGSSWNGIDYMRSLASHVGNPRTAKQVRVRQIFSLITSSLSPLKWAIRIGIVPSSGQSAWSLAMRANYKIVDSYDTGAEIPTFDYSKVALTNGTALYAVSFVAGRDNDYNVQWAPADLDSGFWGGSMYVVVFNETQKIAETYHADISAGSLTIEIVSIKTADTDKVVAYSFARGSAATSLTQYHTLS